LESTLEAFDNVEHAIQLAPGKMGQIYRIRIYITVPLDDIVEHLIANMEERFMSHGPILTCVQVVALYKTMRVEIDAEAHLG
jgi:enamine deaminase RidA (YjgF/YER057c/UK114 family)